MKILISVFAMIVTVASQQAPSIQSELLKARDECYKSENVSQSDIEKLNNHEYDEDLSHEAKCHIRCFGMKTGLWDDTHGYNVEKSYQYVVNTGSKVSKEDLRKCVTPNTDDDDKCTWAAKNMRCLSKNEYFRMKL
ncbi:unnamed protein product [Hermetia illucens]|uniref:Uncharacterized protein n=1 Tax=Hermetia illucens TaxID=343691 RepID=A0A7R8YWV7_HERIL|nr:general odorant-binding protein 99a-like [Hermetia illucens]CAD7087211.1 unnamed protein product [Hermetia illucens]